MHRTGERQRPIAHFTAASWINDPCAPVYDPSTQTYHLFYQCNPNGCEWGNMSWGHIVSNDLLTWERAAYQPALKPDQDYDREGVFTGCFVPLTTKSDNSMSVVYSSIRKLPFHWSTPPYPRNAAGLAIATSWDGGKTWAKSAQNPLLLGEPAEEQVTGFRDPYMARWPAMDQALRVHEPSIYGLVSGGIEGVGPTTFVYKIRPWNLTEWKCLGPLVDLPLRFQPSKKWSGNYGINWECTNFMTLQSGPDCRHFLIIGAEGDVEKEHVKSYRLPVGLPARTVRGQLWMSGELVKTSRGIKFHYKSGGYLDHGPYYAANSFVDLPSGRRIVHGWIPEEDFTLEAAKKKGWNGSLAIPREIFLLRIPHIKKALYSPISEISCLESRVELDGSMTAYTLGVRPVREIERLREGCSQVLKADEPIILPLDSNVSPQPTFRTSTASWELETTISVRPNCKTVGLHIRHSQDLSTRTTIVFSTVTESITVDRHASTRDTSINTCPDAGPFTLFTKQRSPTNESSADSGATSDQELEKLHLRIFSDADVLEVFANDRFALATMVYSDSYGPNLGGVTAFATGEEASAVFEEITLWDGLNGMRSVIVDDGGT